MDGAHLIILQNSKDVVVVNTLLHDCDRLIREFFQVLGASSLQVYHSVLLFVPKQTLLYQVYQHELALPMKIHNSLQKTWSLCMWTIEGHCGHVNSVAFSGDCTHVVSGSSDHTLRLWDTVSGAHLNMLTGHESMVASVAFSPNGMCIASGSSSTVGCSCWCAFEHTHRTCIQCAFCCILPRWHSYHIWIF